MARQRANPLSAIPSADSVRRRLAEVLEEAAKLKILLRTAEEIERSRSAEDCSAEGTR